MLYLRSWLQDYIDLSAYTDQQLSDLISLQSGEVDEFYETKDYFDGKVVIGKVTNLRRHPNADRLQVFDMDLGPKGKVQIVSAATNVTEALICPVALVGCKLAYFNIASRVMRGEVSEGMCLGKSELMLETEMSPGLWDLSEEIDYTSLEKHLGDSICDILPSFFSAQTIFDIKYLPDKIGKMASHLGLAYELSTIIGADKLTPRGQLLLSKDGFIEAVQAFILDLESTDYTLEVEDKTDFAEVFNLFELSLNPAAKFAGVPHQLQLRMYLLEKNQLGTIADISNYLMYDVGQPSHFFGQKVFNSRDQIESPWRILSLTKETKFAGLGKLKDGLIPAGVEVLTEADGKIAAVLGISGAGSTKTESEDTKLVVEVANFLPEKIAQNSFDLSYWSEAGRIWNSGVSPLAIFVWLLQLGYLKQVYNLPWELKLISYQANTKSFKTPFNNFLELFWSIHSQLQEESSLSPDWQYLESRLGLDESFDLNILTHQINYLETDNLCVHPVYSIIRTQEDLLFKLAELAGFSNLQDRFFNYSSQNLNETKVQTYNYFANLAIEYGFSEVVSRPFITKSEAQETLQENTFTALSSQRQDEDILSQNHLSQLLKFVSKNLSNGLKSPQLFELTENYSTTDGYHRSRVLELISADHSPYTHTSLILDILSRQLNYTPDELEIQVSTDSLGRHTNYFYQGRLISSLAQISKKVLKAYQIPLTKEVVFSTIYIDEINLDRFRQTAVYRDLSNYQALTRSYSLNISSDLTWLQLLDITQQTPLALDINLQISPVERFLNPENGCDVLNLEVSFVSFQRNLNSQEVAAWEESWISNLQAKFDLVKFR
jgi:phenylalanyl-tRNA synthetase beta subunit